MTGKTSVGGHRGRMAGAAGGTTVINTAPLFIHGRLRMRQTEQGRTPHRGVVTGFATCAKHARVENGVGMTRDTSTGCARELGIDVALLAIDLLMRARQRKITARVIEGRVLPIGGRVAGGAVRAKFSVVFIVLRVAGIAIRGRPLIDIVFVAILAVGLGVFALQLEGRQVVIESGGRPAIGRVTRRAVRAEAPRVRVVHKMAGRTVLRRRLQVCDGARVGMTVIARNFHVFARQRKRKDIVVEIVPIGVHAIVAGKTVAAPGRLMFTGE